MSNLLKKTSNSLIRSFLVSNQRDSLMIAHFWWATWAIHSHHSFLVSDLRSSLTLLIKKERMSELLFYLFKHTKKGLLTWATWAICSQLLICPERSEQIAHSCSFDLRDLSKLAMSKWANSQPCQEPTNKERMSGKRDQEPTNQVRISVRKD